MKKKRNDTAKELWPQIFERLSLDPAAAVWEPEYEANSEQKLRQGLLGAGWSDEEVTQILIQQDHRLLHVAPAPAGVSPHVHAYYDNLCEEVEDAMDRLGIRSHETVARGVEPRIGPYAAATGVIMTDESIVTVGAHLFRFCGLIARAYTRTLLLAPWLWGGRTVFKSERHRGAARIAGIADVLESDLPVICINRDKHLCALQALH